MVQSSLLNWLSGALSTTPWQDHEVKSPTQIVSKIDARTSQSSATSTRPEPSSEHAQAVSKPTYDADQNVSCQSTSVPTAASIVLLQENHIAGFKRLNALLLPIPYPSQFYTDTTSNPDIYALTRVATWKDASNDTQSNTEGPRLVGAVRCKLIENDIDENGGPLMYISTIGVLAPFRGHGLASSLLATVTKTAIQDYGVCGIAAHVWEDNQDGLEWYKSRGFKIVKTEPHYYRRLAPKTAAYLIYRATSPKDLLTA